MIFNAYARRDGALVLVPDCLVASRDAEARHGPLTFAGRLDTDDLPQSDAWQRVQADIDRQSYAVVRRSMCSLLNSPCLDEAAHA